jgi:hypothetical protein
MARRVMLLMSKNKPIEKIYLPPDKDTVHEYARHVCEAAETDEPEIVYGFAAFINAVATAYVNSLNQEKDKS